MADKVNVRVNVRVRVAAAKVASVRIKALTPIASHARRHHVTAQLSAVMIAALAMIVHPVKAVNVRRARPAQHHGITGAENRHRRRVLLQHHKAITLTEMLTGQLAKVSVKVSVAMQRLPHAAIVRRQPVPMVRTAVQRVNSHVAVKAKTARLEHARFE